jgi:glycerate kinase
MALRILIVPDKFKGTLTAQAAAEAMARGWRSARPGDELELLPMSDGGDGFGEIISQLIGAAPQTVKTVDAAHRPIEATWWWHAASGTAVVESARVIGLAMLPRGKYHPFELDTFGLGAVLRATVAQGARRCLIGIGGSATNDGGFGLARALGWQFFSRREEEITRWTCLHQLSTIRPPAVPRLFDELTVAVDVQNPLLGSSGCSRVYGPQKGLTEFELAERCLSQFAAVLDKTLHLAFAGIPGAGAAGGLGFGLMSFAGARLEPGIEIFERYAKLTERVRSAQLVLTGEGALDAQTLMGKGVGEVASLCRQEGVPCLGLAGVVPEPEKAREKFQAAYALTPGLTDKESALREPAVWLERLAARVAAEWTESVHGEPSPPTIGRASGP